MVEFQHGGLPLHTYHCLYLAILSNLITLLNWSKLIVALSILIDWIKRIPRIHSNTQDKSIGNNDDNQEID